MSEIRFAVRMPENGWLALPPCEGCDWPVSGVMEHRVYGDLPTGDVGEVVYLVDPCPTCDGRASIPGTSGASIDGYRLRLKCSDCETGWVVAGWATIDQALPILDRPSGPEPGDPEMVYFFGSCWWHWKPSEHGDDYAAIQIAGADGGGVAIHLTPVQPVVSNTGDGPGLFVNGILMPCDIDAALPAGVTLIGES